jgi:ADP-ribosylglycohydrolase
VRVHFGDGDVLRAELVSDGDEVRVESERARWTGAFERYSNGEKRLYPGLLECGREARAQGATLLCCGSCVRFRFSGMSDQLSGGSTGYCGLVGFRNQRGVVDVGHLCCEHALATTWPDDERQLSHERLAASDADPRPSRVGAFAGCMLGLAIGDALGFPTEFRTRAQILESFGADGVTDLVALHDPRWPERPAILGARHPAGTYSDDTQMTIAVARGLIDAAGGDLDAQMNAIARHFVEWSRADDNDRAPGSTCMTGCQNLAAGAPWQSAGVAESKGCGSAMRAAPIGLLYWRDRATLLEVSRASSVLTLGHPAAIEGAAAAALLVAMALEKRTPEQMHAELVSHLGGRAAALDARLAQLPEMIEQPPELALSDAGLGEAWVAEEAVASALYCFWRSPDDFAETVITAANTDGDSDSIACIAGSISGAFNGIDAIPSRWRETVENAGELFALAQRLESLARG